MNTSQPKSSRPALLLAPVAVMSVVLLMVVPLPPILLDLLLSMDIGLSVVLLLTVVYIKQPVEFSVFPSLLLLLTLIRLSLNVASTRLILMNARSGMIVAPFGGFVVGGNLVVALVLFLSLVLLSFLVITSRDWRSSEVSARVPH